MTRYLFVYGTLRKRRERTHRLLGDARFVARGTVSGRLYDLGKYPGLRKSSHGEARVGGELYELPGQDAERWLAGIDRYEGAEFQRTRIMVQLVGGPRHRAWVYVLAKAPAKGTPRITGDTHKSAQPHARARRSRAAPRRS